MKKPYVTQQQAINKTLGYLKEGKTKIINVQFCGLGKTELGAWISKNIKGNILFLVHKGSILKQAYNTYKELIPKRSFGYFTSDIKEDNKQVIFATVQTLYKEKNLGRFVEDYFDCIVIDECHHMATPTYNKILDYFNNKYLLGFTATPDRLDKKPILELFDERVGFFDNEGNDISLRMGIEMGYLSPLRYFALNDNVDYNKIEHNGYKYKKSDLDKELIIEKRNDLISNKWLEMGKGKKTIAFCNSVKHATSMLKTFKKYGIKAITLNYKTSKAMQKVIEQQFREGVFDVILTVDLYIEGIDFPDCECVMFLRPTESERIFVQQLGRVMRRFEGKEYGMVMDFVGNQKNAHQRQKWIKKTMLGSSNNLHIPTFGRKPIYYYDPLIQIKIEEEVVDIFKLPPLKYKTLNEAIIEFKNIYGDRIPNRGDLYKNYSWIHSHFNKNNLLDKYCLPSKNLNRGLKKAIDEFNIIYGTDKPFRTHLSKNHNWIYYHFKRSDLLDKYCLPHKKKDITPKELKIVIGKINKKKKITTDELYKKNQRIYDYLQRKNLLDKYFLPSRKRKLNKYIKKYNKIYGNKKPNRYELYKEDSKIYDCFSRYNLLDKYCLPSRTKKKKYAKERRTDE